MISDDEQTVQTLRAAMAVQVRDHHLDPGTVAIAADRLEAGRSRRRSKEYAAVAVCVVGAAAVALVYALTAPGSSGNRSTPPAQASCHGAVVTSSLPVWARGGFSPGAYVNPHVTGARGEILGVLFTDPLRSPPTPGLNNKILWVAKDGGGAGPLVIRARLAGSGRVATRTVADGPGPSIIDLPAPGCWQFSLTWPGHHDTLAVPYSG